jgi:membrane-bound lytic murein transglycosylase F
VLLPDYRKKITDSPSSKDLFGDTIRCAILINPKLNDKGHPSGYIYDLFRNFDNAQNCTVKFETHGSEFAQWVKLSSGLTDMLIINGTRDSVPEIFEDKFITSVPINVSEDLCVVRKDKFDIIRTFNYWFSSFKMSDEYKRLIKKYYRRYIVGDDGNLYPLRKRIISPYDDFLKKEAESLGWDWRLLAALIYQESQFNIGIASGKGAAGLMQITNDIADRYGINEIYDPYENISAGVEYLKYLQRRFARMGISGEDLIIITIASYNCGEGRMDDCMRMAQYDGRNPHKWSDIKEVIPLMSKEKHIREADLKLGRFRGEETINYVDSVLSIYQRYRRIIISR